MSRRRNDAVTVRLREGRPEAFWWKGRRFEVLEIVDMWHETGRWWEGEPERRFVQLVTPYGVYELVEEAERGTWRLHRILD